ncbi:MAG TPA: PEP-CTERM sorting domain-containing protein [Stellaceae bacterium]
MHKQLLVGAALRSFISAAGALGMLASSANATLTLSVTDNGTAIAGCATTTASPLSITCSNANFSAIQVSAQGTPTVPSPDLGTITISATAGALSATHILDAMLTQTGLSNFPGGASSTTFTENSLIGLPGPTMFNMLFNGASIASATLPVSAAPQTAGPFLVNLAAVPGSFTDEQTISVDFGPSIATQQSEAGAQFQAVSAPEPASLAMLGSALIGMGFAAYRRRRRS